MSKNIATSVPCSPILGLQPRQISTLYTQQGACNAVYVRDDRKNPTKFPEKKVQKITKLYSTYQYIPKNIPTLPPSSPTL